MGDGVPAAPLLRPRRPRRGRRDARAPLRRRSTTRASSARSTSRRPTGCRSSSSPTSPTATASTSWPRCARAASTRCRARATSCSRRRRTTCSSARPGIGRVVQRTVELMKEHDTDDVARYGGVDVDMLQRYLNFHYSVSLDLFGAETSTNAANYYAAGLKGRFQEERRDDDHRLRDATPYRAGGDGRGDRRSRSHRACGTQRDPARRLHRRLPEGCRPVEPHPRRGRRRAAAAARRLQPRGRRVRRPRVSPDGRLLTDDEWSRDAVWLPTDDDRTHVESLMTAVTEPGRSPGGSRRRRPASTRQPVDFEYVRDGLTALAGRVDRDDEPVQRHGLAPRPARRRPASGGRRAFPVTAARSPRTRRCNAEVWRVAARARALGVARG